MEVCVNRITCVLNVSLRMYICVLYVGLRREEKGVAEEKEERHQRHQ